MASLQSCSVEIRISNKTQNITLKNPRTYCCSGDCTHSRLPEMSPGSSGICHFLNNSTDSWGVLGILVYEAQSFTLAIYFGNPISNKSRTELGLELSPGKAHLGKLGDTYTRMAHGTYSSSRLDIKFDRITVDKNERTAQVSDGPIKVTATMSKATKSFLEVVVEEQDGSGKEAGIENLCLKGIEKLYLKIHYQQK